MDAKVVVCFSKEKENLSHLLKEYSKCFGSNAEPNSFCKVTDLFHYLNKLQKDIAQIILVAIDTMDDDVLIFLDKLTSISPLSKKIIISKETILSEIKNEVKNTETFQYLSKPWFDVDLKLSIQIAEQTLKTPQMRNKNEEESTALSEKTDVNIEQKLRNLIDSNLAKDKLFSIIAHDLKTPFVGLLGISDVLLNNWQNLTEAEKLDLINELHSSSENTYKLLENLLEWSKAQKEKLKVIPKKINIQNIIDSTIKIAESSASPKNIVIKSCIENEICLEVDENMISTVFRNLITNAVKYTQPGGNIKISATKNENKCTFCVADNGQGINQPFVLELFKIQTKNNSKKECSPNGLGLMLCKEFVERNGGQIWLETQKGKGSKFYFSLPLKS